MKKRIMIMAVFAIIAMGLAMPVSGQPSYKGTPFDAPQSNQMQATAGVLGTDVDDYMNVNYWSGVEFEKWFGFITGGFYDEENNDTWPFAIDLGYATKFGGGEAGKGIYLGTRYAGNIFQITGTGGSATSTNQIDVFYPDPNTGWNPTETVTTTTYKEGWYKSTNQIDILVGFGKMGISAGFFESITTNKFDAPNGTDFIKTVNNETGEISYKDEVVKYVETIGHLTPSLGFGINLSTGSLAIKPYIGLAFDIFKDNNIVNKKDDYSVFEGTTTLGSEGMNYEGHNNGYMLPSVTIGATLELPVQETTEKSIGLEYGFSMGIFSNGYDAGISGTASGDVKWTGSNTVNKFIDRTETTQLANLEFIDRSYMSHAITPSFLITKEINGIKLGFKAEVPINLTFMSEDKYSETRTITTTKYDLTINQQSDTTRTVVDKTYGGFTDTSIYNVAPALGVGASYQLIPNRFRVNAGVSVIPVNFTRRVTKSSPNGEDRTFTTEVDGYGNTTEDTVTIPGTVTYPEKKTNSVEVEDTLNAFSGNVTGGFVFSFNENFALDFLVGVFLSSYSTNYDSSYNVIGYSNTTNQGTNGFNFNLTTVKVLFTFKF